jgi:thiamine-phosphate pyrophosphorylase
VTHAQRLAKVRGLYGIVDDGPAFELSPLAWAEALAKAGAQVLQLRFKHLAMRRALEEARAIRLALPDVVVLVDDRPDLALLAKADGVHVGDSDLPVSEVRRLLGLERLVGATARGTEAARARLAEGADHLGVGPIFASTTKTIDHLLLGIDGLSRLCAGLPGVPVVAISGIDQGNIESVARAGASAAAVIGAVGRAPHPQAAAAELVERFARGAKA